MNTMNTQTNDSDTIRKRLDEIVDDQREAFYSSGWWHSIDLGDGNITSGVHKIEELRENYNSLGLPNDLTGKRVLDIGCWDGFYSFEVERHGAEVVAVDVWRPETFFAAHRALKSRVEFHEMSVYELDRERLGSFDIVLFLGVLYHLQHPLLALQRVCEMTRDLAVIETHAIDNILDTPLPVMEFYEIDALGGQYDNWWGPNCECVIQMARAAGFVRTEVVKREPTRTMVKAYRHRGHLELNESPSLEIRRIVNACTGEQRFPRRGRHAFLALMVDGLPSDAQRENVKVEIGGYGAYAVYFGPSRHPQDAGCTQITVPIPLGLSVGNVGLRLTYDKLYANEVEISLGEGSQW